MAELEICQLSRRFKSGGGLNEVSITVETGELFVLVGPSGCGKSTMLRLIAGLEQPDSGEIRIGDQAVADRRDLIAMVFQSHALYPHMTAFDNIAFPLRLRRISKPEIERRVAQAAAMAALQIDLRRRPAELSGGERQRVALARALIREPRVILMDEPLSSLDAQLRGRLRVELKEFQKRTGRTIIYVTHDQLEALTLGDRIAVMRAGAVEQLGTPTEIYQRPANLFVATFIGQPPMNILRCRLRDSASPAPALPRMRRRYRRLWKLATNWPWSCRPGLVERSCSAYVRRTSAAIQIATRSVLKPPSRESSLSVRGTSPTRPSPARG